MSERSPFRAAAGPDGQDERVARRPVAEQIVRRIATLFESGELAPGDKLPPERRLAEVFGVSRGSVREAIKSLVEAGLLESRAGSGTYVVADRQDEFAASLLDSLGRSRKKLKEILQVRQILEPQIARLAAQNATPADVVQLRMLLTCQRREIATGGTGRDADSAFHATLARITGNPVLFELVEDIADILAESRSDFLQTEERRIASLAAHERILIAVEKGDPEAAQKCMEEHLRRIEQHFITGAPRVPKT